METTKELIEFLEYKISYYYDQLKPSKSKRMTQKFKAYLSGNLNAYELILEKLEEMKK